jgi:hypothetical protein
MAHNGGLSQLNFWFLDSGAATFAFNNLLKVSRNPSLISVVGNPEPSTMNENGYPTSIVSGGTTREFWFPPQSARAGNYIVKWVGTCTLAITGSGTYNVVSGSLTGTDGEAEIEVVGTDVDALISSFLRITALGGSPLTKIQICHVDDEARMDAGYTFRQGFIEKMQEANFGTYRFLDWQFVNASMVGLWEHRKPADYISYMADEARASYYGGTTTLTGDTYAVAAPSAWSVLADRNVVIAKIDSAGPSGTVYLEVGTTGPKPILGWYGTELSGSNLTADRFACFIYNEYLDGWMSNGATPTSRYLDNYIPIEVILELCNELNAHAWVHGPYLSLDASNRDFVTEMATYFRDNLNNGLQFICEPANEVWNPGSAFKATTYGRTYALARWGFANDENNWYGMVLSEMGEDVSTVFSGDATRYKVLCGVQTYGSSGGTAIARMESTRWVAEGGGNNPASDFVTHGAVAGYWAFSGGQSGSFPYSSREMQCAWDYNQAGTEAERTAILTDLITTRLTNNERYTPTNVKGQWTQWKTYFDTYSVPMVQYEGGYSPDYIVNPGTTPIQRVVNAATQANPCVLTLAANSVIELPPVGSSVTFPTVSVGMTQVSGNTYTVLATSGSYNSAGNTITIDVDASGFSAWSGTSLLTLTSMTAMINTLRAASKYADEVGTIEAQLYEDFADYNGSAPSMYILCGYDQAWSVFDPSLFDDPTPRWQVAIDYNAVAAPTADFSGTPLTGTTPLSVTFTDASTDSPTSWLWERDNGSGWATFSTSQNPTASFTAGTWSVRLTATNSNGSDTLTRTDYIAVSGTDTGIGGSWSNPGKGRKKKQFKYGHEVVQEEREAAQQAYLASRAEVVKGSAERIQKGQELLGRTLTEEQAEQLAEALQEGDETAIALIFAVAATIH